MKRHTGGVISMGYVLLHGKSSKQKVNVKSSMESELVGVRQYIPYNIWLIMFLDAQRYGLKNNMIHQDNRSAILMKKNGRNLCIGNSWHVKIRYFLLKIILIKTK